MDNNQEIFNNIPLYDFCSPKCPYFPDMSCQEKDWDFDEELGYKTRKKKIVFNCGYDGSPINWTKKCPRYTCCELPTT